MKILIVEDEEKLAKALKRGLENEAFAADYVTSGNAALTRIELHHVDYDLIILDLMLPEKSGFDICREARAKNITTPILVLTARGEIDDKLKALNAGADDYLVKPFSFAELLARVRAILRRPAETLPNVIKLRDVIIDPVTRRVTRKNREVQLTLKEFGLLEYFMRHPNQVLTREQIMGHLWGFDFDSFSNVVDVHVKNLRHKIDNSKHEKLLETIRGVGYRFKN